MSMLDWVAEGSKGTPPAEYQGPIQRSDERVALPGEAREPYCAAKCCKERFRFGAIIFTQPLCYLSTVQVVAVSCPRKPQRRWRC